MILNHIRSIFSVEDLRKKIIFTLVLVLVYKFLSIIPVPGADTEGIKQIFEGREWLAFFNALMWGWLESFSIILMGLSPYINAMIIVQLLTVVIPKLESIKKEWEAGQKKLNKITRWLTLPLAFVQSYWMILLLNNIAQQPVFDSSDTAALLMAMVIITGWTMFLVWLWEIMTEYGITNGISIIISASVLAGTPSLIASYFPTQGNIPDTIKSSFSNAEWIFGLSSGLSFLLVLLLTFAVIYVIVKFTEGHRRIPVIYARTGREEKSYFPIKINQAGMVPIIFAVSLVTFPSILGEILSRKSETLGTFGLFLAQNFSFSNPSWLYIGIYFLLVVLFTYFYISITFNTEEIAETIQKRWGFIPGVRPGSETAEYLAKVSSHLTLFGGSFLALIAVFPYLMQKINGELVDFIVPWAWLIIIVSVILDLVRKIDTEMQMYDYSKFK